MFGPARGEVKWHLTVEANLAIEPTRALLASVEGGVTIKPFITVDLRLRLLYSLSGWNQLILTTTHLPKRNITHRASNFSKDSLRTMEV